MKNSESTSKRQKQIEFVNEQLNNVCKFLKSGDANKQKNKCIDLDQFDKNA